MTAARPAVAFGVGTETGPEPLTGRPGGSWPAIRQTPWRSPPPSPATRPPMTGGWVAHWAAPRGADWPPDTFYARAGQGKKSRAGGM